MRKVILAIIIFFAIIAFLAYLPIEQWVGDGRGDWEKELCNGYAITKVNSLNICLTYHQDGQVGSSIQIDNLYVTAYQNCDSYILAKGIPTQDGYLSEDDLDNGNIVYYFIDSLEHQNVGPFDSYAAFQNFCNEQDITVSENWEKTITGIKKTKNGLRVETVAG